MDIDTEPLLTRGESRRSSTDLGDVVCPEHSPQSGPWNGIMDCCCLVSLSRSAASGTRRNDVVSTDTEEPLSEKRMVYISTKESIDLLSDEGSSFQDDQWRLRLRDKLMSYKESVFPMYHELATTATFDSTLETLTRNYTDNGLAKFVPNIRRILDMIEPFVAAITTMVQSNPTVACFVWGSVQLVLMVGFNHLWH